MMLNVSGFCLLVISIINLEAVCGISPILIVPGYTGSQLEAKISDGSSCDTGGKWEVYWVNINEDNECINKVLSLNYNNNTGRYSNISQIEVRVPGFGDTQTVEFLDNDLEQTAYFHILVNFFVGKGYKRGETIRAAPYDWRLAADELERVGYYSDFKSLIEDMYKTDNEKVSIVVHSMGGPVTLYFLNKVVTQDWKDKYINAYIPLSGAWSGANGGLLTFISGVRLEAYQKPFGTSFQSMESTAWLLPDPSTWKDKVIVTTASKNYSAGQYEEMFNDINRTVDYGKLKHSFALNAGYPAPNVPTHSFYGVNVSTIQIINYGSNFPKQYETFTYGDGDGVVNLLTSEICLKWAKQKAPFYHKTFPQTTHGNMVTDPAVLNAIAEAVVNPN